MENLDNGKAALDDSARSASLTGIPDCPFESIDRRCKVNVWFIMIWGGGVTSIARIIG